LPKQIKRSRVNIDYTHTVLLLVAGLPLAAYLLWQGWRNRAKPGALPFVVILALSTSWVIGSIFELLSVNLYTKLLWADLQYLPIVFLPVACLAMALDYTGNRAWLTRRNISALSIVPLLSLGLMWTNSHHNLMRAAAWLDTDGGHAVIGRTFGPWFWVHSVYSYLLLATAVAFLVHAIISSPPLYRKQPAVLVAGLAVPVVWNVFYLLKPGVLPLFDYTPAVFGVAELIMAYGLFRFRVFNLVLVARDTLLENLSDGLLVLDTANRVADLNESARALIGRPAEQILSRPLAETWGGWQQVAGPFEAGAEHTVISVGINGDRRDYEVKISPLPGRGEVMGRLLVIRDVSERSELEESLRKQALTDGLTGLANRTLFMTKLADAVHFAHRHPDKLFALISLDLDHFKLINDTAGHPAGDAVLESVAIRLKRCVREIDTVARLGGDEFIILLEDINSTRDVIVVMERIQDELRAPVYVHHQQMVSSASIGVVIWDSSYRDSEDLLRAADAAMYQAKEAGGACYRIFDERMHRALLDALQAETDLRLALDRGDFALEYQPVIDLKTGAVTSLEAFIRWHHPRRGRVAPKDFISVAETSGLIVPLGDTIFDQVCAQLIDWQSPACPAFELPVSLNVSPRQLTETGFVDAILTRLADWRLAPGSLVFEITETALTRDPARARTAMKELSSLGIRVCLDDFGTGPSSLQHLIAFPGQELKIDRVLVAKMAGSAKELEIVKSIAGLAHALGLVVTAEGVESGREWELLEASGCDRAQGYYCGVPMSPVDLLKYLKDRSSPVESVAVSRKRATS
jgi:diguanylate cyclase (GGDEF)-like protein/PAS domain S-box-containing protein